MKGDNKVEKIISASSSELKDITNILSNYYNFTTDENENIFIKEKTQIDNSNTDAYVITLKNQLQLKMQEALDAQLATITALSTLAETCDSYTHNHIPRIKLYCMTMADYIHNNEYSYDEVDEEFVDNIFYAAALHDIGKVSVPNDILRKPGKLTDEEFEEIKKHPLYGADTLMGVLDMHPDNKFLVMGLQIARYHHERYDGTGYPDGLKNSEIPLPARIMAVSDLYDALRSERPYKKPLDHLTAKSVILNETNTHLDPILVEVFLSCEDEFVRINDALPAMKSF